MSNLKFVILDYLTAKYFGLTPKFDKILAPDMLESQSRALKTRMIA